MVVGAGALAEINKQVDLSKTAFETTDEPYFNEVSAFKVNELGLSDEQINVDLEGKDINLFWLSKERFLFIILGVCAIYFLFILIEGGFFARF